MRDATFFTHPKSNWQRRYEALRASFVECLPDKVVAQRFGYSPSYISLLRHQFRHGKIDLLDPVPEGRTPRRKIGATAGEKIIQYRLQNRSAADIALLLEQEGIDVSVRTVERVLAEEGFPKLPRRTQIKMGEGVKKAEVLEDPEPISPAQLEGRRMESAGAGVFLFTPFLAQLNFHKVLQEAELPKYKNISAQSYLLSFLALKLLGTERYAHIGDHASDVGVGLFAGLNMLPKSTALSTYSYSLDPTHITRLQEAFVRQAARLGFYESSIINLHYHTVPYLDPESIRDAPWAETRNKRMKGALTLFGQDAKSKRILYSAPHIQRQESHDQILAFLPYWHRIGQGVSATFLFNSKFTSYSRLAELDQQGVKFITLRRRGKKLLEEVNQVKSWKRIQFPQEKQSYPDPMVHELTIKLRGYSRDLRQIIIRGNNREKPLFLITNDFDVPVDLLVGNYAHRWQIENSISETLQFFHLNTPSSPIPSRVSFDLVMTLMADTLYWRLAQNLRGFENCKASTIFHSFINCQGLVAVQGKNLVVTYPKHGHNPILQGVPWQQLPNKLPWLDEVTITLQFK